MGREWERYTEVNKVDSGKTLGRRVGGAEFSNIHPIEKISKEDKGQCYFNLFGLSNKGEFCRTVT